MAQNSIARLAVQIVTDTQGMTSGFQNARAQTIRFANAIEGNNARLSKFGQISAAAAKSFSGLGGPGALAFKFAGLAGPVGLAAAAITGLAIGIARSASASEDFRIERFRELGRLAPDVITTKEAIGGITEQLSVFNELLFKSAGGGALKRFLSDIGENAGKLNETLFGDKFAEVTKARALARDDSLLALKKKSDELVKSLRTPKEVFADTVGELVRMREEGFIASETLSRGAQKAAEEFRRLSGDVKKTKDEAAGIPALEIGTQAARTAILKNNARTDRGGSPVESEIAATLKRIEAIERDLLKKPPARFMKAEL